VNLRDISDKGRGEKPNSKKLRYEVCVLHKDNDPDEVPEIIIKCRWHFLAVAAAESLKGQLVFAEAIIRNA
jgi:hypothetical protein